MLARSRSARRSLACIALASAYLLLGGGVASAAPGDVDLTFGDAGAKTVALASAADVGGVVQRADGTFIVGVSLDNVAATLALTRSGQRLTSYGALGASGITVPGATSVTITDVAKQRDDRVVEVGYESPTSGSQRFVVARFRTGGAADGSFSGDGVVTIRFSQGDASGYGVAIQPDGKIVVVGEVDPASGVSNPAIVRLNTNGTLDRTFGDHGRKVVKVPDHVKGYDSPWRVVVQSHGRLAMGGWVDRGNGNYRTLVIRLRSNGAPDRTFGGDGFVSVDADGVDNYAYGLAKDGAKLVLGVHTSTDAAGFVRLNFDGKRDATFGGDGVVTHTLSVNWEVSAVAVLRDHRIVASNRNGGGPDLVQLRAGGKLDGSFGSGGEATGPLTTVTGFDLMVTAKGKIVVAGTDGTGDVVAARFLGP
jgi:uncharacterized delta-60 repeat protein